MLGSHIDTVRDAGTLRRPARRDPRDRGGRGHARRAAVRARGDRVRRRGGRPLPAHVSSAAAAGRGCSRPRTATVTDSEGTPLAEAVRAMGGDPAGARSPLGARRPARVTSRCTSSRARCSRTRTSPVGIVTAIAAQSRGERRLHGDGRARGQHAHASAPRRARRCRRARPRGRAARARDGRPDGDGRTHPQRPERRERDRRQDQALYDVRHQDDGMRDRARDGLEEAARAIAERRGPRARLAAGATTCPPCRCRRACASGSLVRARERACARSSSAAAPATTPSPRRS